MSETTLHSLLRRQLQRAGADAERVPCSPEAWADFVGRIDRAYRSTDQDRYTHERTLEMLSREMGELNEELAEERDKLRAVISEGVCHLDPNWTVRFLNPEAERLMGRTNEEASGRRLFDLIGFVSDENCSWSLDIATVQSELMAGASFSREEAHLRRADGDALPVSFAFNPILKGGALIGSILVFRDISARKKAADRLQRANESLAEANARALETMMELKEARDAAQAASRSKSLFLATMSHEIRTPMHGIMGTLELLRETELAAEQRDYVVTAHDSAEKLLGIINDILDFSKIEAGKMELEDVEFELRDVVEGVATLHAERAHRRGIELACLVPDDLPPIVFGDPVRLRQVLSNLVSNAAKFTEDGEVFLRARRVGEAPSQIEIRFEVIDTGIGISEEQRETIFRAFSQADSSTTRKYGGTGLGLAICRDLVHLMGGELELESRVGEGSMFSFTITFRKSARKVRPRRAELVGLRMLIVDDNATNRLIVENYLDGWGVVYSSVGDGQTALARLREQPYDLAILDFQMPGMDGVELAQRIRKDPALASVRLLMLSSIGAPNAANREALDVWIAKPVRQSLLFDSIRLALGGEEAAQDDGRQPDEALAGHVLLVEDNQVNQRVASAMLGKLGVTVEIACNGREGVEMALAGTYDAVLMDCFMPEMDGFEASRALRDKGYCGPIIAMTANAMRGDRERCLAAGMDDYLSKPVTKAALREKLVLWFTAPRG